MFGVLILWVHFLLLLVISISFLVLIMCPKWIESKSTRTNDAKVVLDFVRTHIFNRFEIPKAIISDRDTYFCNRSMEALLHKYYMTHRTFTAYHIKRMAKLKFQIEKTSPFWRRQCNLTDKIGVCDLVMPFGLIGLLTNHL